MSVEQPITLLKNVCYNSIIDIIADYSLLKAKGCISTKVLDCVEVPYEMNFYNFVDVVVIPVKSMKELVPHILELLIIYGQDPLTNYFATVI